MIIMPRRSIPISQKEIFYWNDIASDIFNSYINREWIVSLFDETKYLISDIIGNEMIKTFYEEMINSFISGFFDARKTEFLEKMRSESDRISYWNQI